MLVLAPGGALGSRAMRRSAPRLAGKRLTSLIRLLEAPLAGRRLANLVMRERILRELDRQDVPDTARRPVISFRPAPRRPDQG